MDKEIHKYMQIDEQMDRLMNEEPDKPVQVRTQVLIYQDLIVVVIQVEKVFMESWLLYP